MLRKRIAILIVLILNVVVTMTAAKRFTLVIDAGHGGHDAGAVGTYSKEKNINLRTALAFGRYVEKNCPDVNVIYTRKSDVFVTLHGRADIANKAKADLFVSIHTNSLPSGHIARGLETYTLGMHRAADNFDVAKRENSVILIEKDYKERYQGFDPNSAESYIIFELMQDNNMQRSVEMAKLVQSKVCATASRPNKGVKQAGFLVLRETSMPSCLIELGFISTPAEERLLNDDAQIDNMARGIYQAFVAYRSKYDSTAKPPFAEGESAQTPVPSVTQEQPTETAAPSLPAEQQQPVPEPMLQSVQPEQQAPQQPPLAVETPQQSEMPTRAAAEETNADDAKPVFKVQIFVAEKVLRNSDARFKGESDAQYYKENGMVKYTIGASTDYNEIYRLRKTLLEKFQGCFIIAFKNGEKMNVNEAIREFKANR